MGLSGKRVLYISYNGMLDPLGQSQVLPYLRELASLGVDFTILSFERDEAWTVEGKKRQLELKSSLRTDGIDWVSLKYHRRPSLPATIYDVLAGVKTARRIVKSADIQMVHARSHIPATISLAVKRLFGTKFIFDLRGLMGEEYVDAGHWRRESIPFRLTKRVERAAFASADGIVTLTNRIWPIISEWSGLAGRTLPHEVVPCCADLERFRFDPEARQSVRNRLGIADKLVIVYSGSIGGWYLTPEMADFFRTATEAYKDIHALWLVPSGHDLIRSLMQERGIGADRYSVISARPDEVPAYLSASDAGLAFIKPCLSKLASSPTKNAEYLACGLPLILNAGVGDSDSLITEHGAGVLITTHGSAEYLEAIGELRSTFTGLNENRSVLRNIAERLFDVRGIGIERYARLYERVFAGSVVESLPVAEISR